MAPKKTTMDTISPLKPGLPNRKPSFLDGDKALQPNPDLDKCVAWCNSHVEAFKSLENTDEEPVLTASRVFGDIQVTVARTWFSLVITVQALGDALLRQGFVSGSVKGMHCAVITPEAVVYSLGANRKKFKEQER